MSTTYRHRTTGRTPLHLAALALAIGLGTLALAFGPPPALWWLPVGGATLALAWTVWRNPRHGVEIGPHGLTVTVHDSSTTWPLAEIDHLEIVSWTESTDYRLHLADGRRIELFSGSFPGQAETERAARAAGLAVRSR